MDNYIGDNGCGLVLAHSLQQPRVGRRIEQIAQCFSKTIVLGYDRDIYAGRFTLNSSSVAIASLGSVKKGITLKRLLRFIAAIFLILKSFVLHRPRVVYGFSADLGLISLLSKSMGSIVVYEISDLHFSLRHSGMANSLGLMLENLVLRFSDVVVLTSPYFAPDLVSRVPCVGNKLVVIENGLPQEFCAIVKQPPPFTVLTGSREIRLGIIGAVRYPEILLQFGRLLRSRGTSFRCHVYGGGYWADLFESNAATDAAFIYHGPFRNPDDLERIYNSVDLVLALYDVDDPNAKVLLPNRLYEAVYFRRPLIVPKYTALAERVTTWNVGVSVDWSDGEDVTRLLDGINYEFIEKYSKACAAVPLAFLQSEPSQLIARLTVPSITTPAP